MLKKHSDHSTSHNNNALDKLPQKLSDRFEKHLVVHNNDMTAIELLANHTSFSKQKLKQIMKKGAVWLTQGQSTRRIRRASKKLSTGQTLHLYYDAQIIQASELTAVLIADEGDYSVWCKPTGMLSQGSKYGDHTTIYRWAETHLKPQRNAFLVHRLDRATSGLILIAHSKKAAASLAQLFALRAINKYYKALVEGVPDSPSTINKTLEGKKAITKILSASILPDKNHSLLDIQILTGRKHQIRQHLVHINHSIVGDRLYGTGNKNTIDLCLTAYKINFISPFDQQEKHYELANEYYPALY